MNIIVNKKGTIKSTINDQYLHISVLVVINISRFAANSDT